VLFRSTQFGIDPRRAVIWGGSAGGQLAALAATSCNVEALEPAFPQSPLATQPDCVQGLVAWYGVFDFVNGPLSDALEQPANSAVGKYLGCAPADCKATAELASPVTHLDRDDPPVLLIHGEVDKVVPVAQSQLFYEALLSKKVAAQLVRIKNSDHSFIGADVATTRSDSLRALTATFEFIDTTLGGRSPVK